MQPTGFNTSPETGAGIQHPIVWIFFFSDDTRKTELLQETGGEREKYRPDMTPEKEYSDENGKKMR